MSSGITTATSTGPSLVWSWSLNCILLVCILDPCSQNLSFRVIHDSFVDSSIKIIRSHQQLKAQISRDIHISDARALAMLLVVIEVLDDFLEDDSTQVLKVANPALSFTEVVWRCVSLAS